MRAWFQKTRLRLPTVDVSKLLRSHFLNCYTPNQNDLPFHLIGSMFSNYMTQLCSRPVKLARKTLMKQRNKQKQPRRSGSWQNRNGRKQNASWKSSKGTLMCFVAPLEHLFYVAMESWTSSRCQSFTPSRVSCVMT